MSEDKYAAYEVIVGLEVHAQLSTRSKMYCADSAEYGGLPNTQVSPVSLGLPGTLPVLNSRAVEYAVKLGLATNCTIHRYNQFARKNYFYADLPKGYQITQDSTPICTDGVIEFELEQEIKKVRLIRIHMEEDAGKSLHDIDPFYTLVDLNRAGVPLLEIVSYPDLRSGDEAMAYLNEIRKLVRHLDICDGNMEEGSLRCDANISVRKKGSTVLNPRTEVKNMNSMRNVKRAIEYEFMRQVDILESGGVLTQETRGFDALKGITTPQRTKEHAHDYRYFPEPDLPPLLLSDAFIEKVKRGIPKLPAQLKQEYITNYGLPEYDARQITDDKAFVRFFEEAIQYTRNYKAVSNWLLGPVRNYLNEQGITLEQLSFSPKQLAEIIHLIDEGKTNFSVCATHIFPAMIKDGSKTALQIAEALNLIQTSDEDFIGKLIKEVLSEMPAKVKEYKQGKKGLLGLFVGEVMKRSKGKADPKTVNKLLAQALEEIAVS
ncbi:MAG: Asp-tRNA(Asn)/Glu-tRNA(Gln) amidotransferase subunit GatB [Chitinophagales bacterium]|nr:Asp-tRNA(Asn)/Glu-tRNA(Gln) amidotransferase subunit GatB [Chitinophagales bacterium]MDW8273396.1 Asp-tRNA(Asn)/Glu-tRNA(Gln) amidotransferase subunit GatB [Chitinophagales bacterium]